MNDLRDFFKLLRYLLIFLVVVVGMAFYSNAHAADYGCDSTWSAFSTVDYDYLSSAEFDRLNYWKQTKIKLAASYKPPKYVYFRKESAKWEPPKYPNPSNPNLGNIVVYFEFRFCTSEVPEPKPCETPKTDEQCKKGQRRQVTLPKSFWSQSTAEHKGCVISVESPGVGIANMGDDRATGHVNMMGSTGKSWCANTGTSDTTAQSIGASGEFTPTTTPKDCPKGSVTMGGQSWCYTGASDGVTKPDGSVPDDGIHDNGTSDDGNGGDVDSSIDREPGDGSGGDGGGGDTGGGGDGSGGGTGDGNGISKGDIKDGVKEGVEEALGKGSGAPAPIVLPTVDDVEGGINGVMGRYKQRINNAPISNAFNSISFSVPSAGCSPWGIHLDYLDVSLQFDQCTFLNTHSGMIGAIMMAMFAGLSVVLFLKA